MTWLELKEFLDSFSSHLLGKFPHKYDIFSLENKNNKLLLEWLQQEGYWTFAPHRSTKLIGYHQIVNFWFRGRFMPPGSGDFLETHHISGNTLGPSNHPNNLVYLTPQDHSLVSKFQRRLSKLKVKQFYKLEKHLPLQNKTQYNRQGKLIKNWTKFIIGVICITCSKSSQWVNYTLANSNTLPPIIHIVHYIERYLKQFKSFNPSPPL